MIYKKQKILYTFSIALLLTGLTTTILLYRDNVINKGNLKSSELAIEKLKNERLERDLRSLSEQVEGMIKKDLEDSTEIKTELKNTPVVEKSNSVGKIPATNINKGERYCPSLELCGEEYTDDYTCNNAVCCLVDGQRMLSFHKPSCDDLYEPIYFKSLKKSFKCAKNAKDSLIRMDEEFEKELEEYSQCLYSFEEEYCREYLKTSEELEDSMTNYCE